ncbi:MAG TPA: ABC transporter permease [Candidatus Kaiserbacteria bacterium]|nr:ABC transporter permease [Candidatus Kaiserbacteria bacterium]
MIWTNIRRVSTAGAKNFARSGSVSFATVLIMTVTLGIIGALIFLSALLNYTLTGIRNKVDVSVYFVTTATTENITSLQHRLEQLPQVSEVTYTSREKALTEFRARHANDQLTLQALDELGGNPLDASLAIKAKDPSQYESIVDFLNTGPALSSSGTSIIDRINYAQNKSVINRLSLAITATQKVGIAVVLIFALASIIIAFATVRLAIYTSRDEIAVMRLVGASNAYIRWPFVMTGVLSGIVSAIIVLVLFLPVTWYVGHVTTLWFGGFDFFAYYRSHIWALSGALLGSGIVLGGVASFLAIRRYLTT